MPLSPQRRAPLTVSRPHQQIGEVETDRRDPQPDGARARLGQLGPGDDERRAQAFDLPAAHRPNRRFPRAGAGRRIFRKTQQKRGKFAICVAFQKSR